MQELKWKWKHDLLSPLHSQNTSAGGGISEGSNSPSSCPPLFVVDKNPVACFIKGYVPTERVVRWLRSEQWCCEMQVPLGCSQSHYALESQVTVSMRKGNLTESLSESDSSGFPQAGGRGAFSQDTPMVWEWRLLSVPASDLT